MPDIQRTLRCMDPSPEAPEDKSVCRALQDWFAKNHTGLFKIDGVVGLASPTERDPAIVVRIERFANGNVRDLIAQTLNGRPFRIETAERHDSDPQLRLFDNAAS